MKFSGFKIFTFAADDPSVPQPPTEEPPLVQSNEVSNMFHMVPDDVKRAAPWVRNLVDTIVDLVDLVDL